MPINQNVELVTHFGASKLRSLATRAEQKLLPAPRIIFDVKTGKQSGSLAIIEQQECSIGENFDDDLFLWDPSSPDGKVNISCVNAAVGTIVSVRSTKKNVLLNGQPVNAEPRTEKLPCTLTIGSNQIDVYTQNVTINSHSSKWFHLKWMIVFFGLLLLGFFALKSMPLNNGASIAEVNKAPLSTPNLQANAAAQLATSMVEKTSLNSQINLVTENNVITIQGTIPPNQVQDWHQLRSQLDVALSNQASVYDVVFSKNLTNIPAIGFVSLEPTRFLILSNSTRIDIGEIFIDDWKLTDVLGSGAVLKRNNETTTIRWGAIDVQN